MVFDKYGLSLYDFMRKNGFRPFSVPETKKIGYQLLHAIQRIKNTIFRGILLTKIDLHNLTLIHTDLKPENILLVNSDYEMVDVPGAAHSVLFWLCY